MFWYAQITYYIYVLHNISTVPGTRHSEGYSYPEIHRRLGIAGSIMAQLDNVWCQQRLSLSTKLKIALYGSETWKMCKVDSDRIQSFHMQALRRILGIRWYDKVSNTVVNERTSGSLNETTGPTVSYC